MRERPEKKVRHERAMIQTPLRLGGSLPAFSQI